jgi:hypothetical protein
MTYVNIVIPSASRLFRWPLSHRLHGQNFACFYFYAETDTLLSRKSTTRQLQTLKYRVLQTSLSGLFLSNMKFAVCYETVRFNTVTTKSHQFSLVCKLITCFLNMDFNTFLDAFVNQVISSTEIFQRNFYVFLEECRILHRNLFYSLALIIPRKTEH